MKKVHSYLAEFIVSTGKGDIVIFLRDEEIVFDKLSMQKFNTILAILNASKSVFYDGVKLFTEEEISRNESIS